MRRRDAVNRDEAYLHPLMNLCIVSLAAENYSDINIHQTINCCDMLSGFTHRVVSLYQIYLRQWYSLNSSLDGPTYNEDSGSPCDSAKFDCVNGWCKELSRYVYRLIY